MEFLQSTFLAGWWSRTLWIGFLRRRESERKESARAAGDQQSWRMRAALHNGEGRIDRRGGSFGPSERIYNGEI